MCDCGEPQDFYSISGVTTSYPIYLQNIPGAVREILVIIHKQNSSVQHVPPGTWKWSLGVRQKKNKMTSI